MSQREDDINESSLRSDSDIDDDDDDEDEEG